MCIPQLLIQYYIRHILMKAGNQQQIKSVVSSQLYEELLALCRKANMHARKCLSHSANVLEKIITEACANKVCLSRGYLPSLKRLKIKKKYQFAYHSLPIEAHFQYSKWNLLSLFDSLCFLAQYVSRSKVPLQDIWVLAINQDKELNKECYDAAVKWFQDLNELPHIKVTRCLVSSGGRGSFSLHVFTDASGTTYGMTTTQQMQDVFKPDG